jgi:hypothetical protein
MRTHRTQLLLFLTLLAAGAAFLAFARQDQARAAALAAQRDLGQVHRQLTEIAAANSGGQHIAVGQLDAAELQSRLTAAAVDAGVLDRLVDKESGLPTRLENSDYNELLIMLRFDKISLKQLTIFFDRLAATDPGSRVKTIELSPPEPSPAASNPRSPVAADNGEERWTAFVSVAYLMHAPKALGRDNR